MWLRNGDLFIYLQADFQNMEATNAVTLTCVMYSFIVVSRGECSANPVDSMTRDRWSNLLINSNQTTKRNLDCSVFVDLGLTETRSPGHKAYRISSRRCYFVHLPGLV